jgi:hypothetical protein
VNAVLAAAAREIRLALRRADTAAQLGGVPPEEVLRLVAETDLVQDVIARERRKRKALREQLVARHASAPAKASKELESLVKARDAARVKLEEADAARLAAQNAAVAAQVALSAAECGLRNEVGAFEMELERTADPVIIAVVARLEEEFQRARAVDVFSRPSRFVPDPKSKLPEHQQRSAYMQGLQNAAQDADRLKFSVLAGEELLAALASIEARIPHREPQGQLPEYADRGHVNGT